MSVPVDAARRRRRGRGGRPSRPDGRSRQRVVRCPRHRRCRASARRPDGRSTVPHHLRPPRPPRRAASMRDQRHARRPRAPEQPPSQHPVPVCVAISAGPLAEIATQTMIGSVRETWGRVVEAGVEASAEFLGAVVGPRAGAPSLHDHCAGRRGTEQPGQAQPLPPAHGPYSTRRGADADHPRRGRERQPQRRHLVVHRTQARRPGDPAGDEQPGQPRGDGAGDRRPPAAVVARRAGTFDGRRLDRRGAARRPAAPTDRSRRDVGQPVRAARVRPPARSGSLPRHGERGARRRARIQRPALPEHARPRRPLAQGPRPPPASPSRTSTAPNSWR